MRVRRTFAFVDVSGFTALTELKGDEDAVEVLTTFRCLLRYICGRRGVRIVKWLGDGAMLVCVETAPLVAAVLELHYAWGPGREPGSNRLDPFRRHLGRRHPDGRGRLCGALRERGRPVVRPQSRW